MSDGFKGSHEFEAGPRGRKYPMIAESWRRNWQRSFLLQYPPEARKIIYTTNAIESLHMQLRKVLKNRGHFPVLGEMTQSEGSR